jgi:hypothetical protein
MGCDCTAVYIEIVAAFAARPQNLNQPYKWSLPGLQHNLIIEHSYDIAVISELLQPSYLHHYFLPNYFIIKYAVTKLFLTIPLIEFHSNMLIRMQSS